MSPFNFLFIVILLAIGFAVFSIFVVPIAFFLIKLVFLSTSSNHQKIRLAVGLSLVGYTGLVISLWLWHNSPAEVFEFAFEFYPTPDVEIISCEREGLSDYGRDHLCFTASSETVDRILRLKFNTSLEKSLPESDGVYYFSKEFSQRFAQEKCELEYVPSLEKVSYTWSGYD